MAKKKDLRTILFEQIDKEGFDKVIFELTNLVTPNIPLNADAWIFAERLRDFIRQEIKHREVMNSPFFKG